MNAHPHSARAAEAAEAAGAQGSFWPMHDKLLENQSALEDRHFAKYARKLGLDADRLIADLMNATHTLRVREDIRSGARAGVNGTPTFFINGVRYDGPLNEEALFTILLAQATESLWMRTKCDSNVRKALGILKNEADRSALRHQRIPTALESALQS